MIVERARSGQFSWKRSSFWQFCNAIERSPSLRAVHFFFSKQRGTHSLPFLVRQATKSWIDCSCKAEKSVPPLHCNRRSILRVSEKEERAWPPPSPLLQLLLLTASRVEFSLQPSFGHWKSKWGELLARPPTARDCHHLLLRSFLVFCGCVQAQFSCSRERPPANLLNFARCVFL